MNGEFPAVNLPVRFVSAGQVVSEPGWIHPKRLLNHHMIIVVKQGQFGLILGGRPCVLSAGQALLLPSGLEHCGFPVEQESAPVFCWACFKDDSLSGRDAASLGTLLFDLPAQVFDCVVSDFHHLINRSCVMKGRTELCDYLLSVILLEMRQDVAEEPHTAVVNRMLEYIRLHCFEKLDWNSLSLALGYTGDYLSRQFHSHMKCSFRQYIHLLRMDRACRELLSSEKPVQQIASECGYGNVKFFSTVFLKTEGLSPTAYRNRFSRIHQNNA